MPAHYMNISMEMLFYSVTAVPIMFCVRPIHALPVATWVHKHSWTLSGKGTAAWQSNFV